MTIFDFVLVVFIYSFFICVLSVFIAFSFIVFHKACVEERNKLKGLKNCDDSKLKVVRRSEEIKDVSNKERRSRQEIWNFLNYDGGAMPEVESALDSAKSGSGVNE